MSFKHNPGAHTVQLGKRPSAPAPENLADYSSGSRWRVDKQPNQGGWVFYRAEGATTLGWLHRGGSFGRSGGRRGAYHPPLNRCCQGWRAGSEDGETGRAFAADGSCEALGAATCRPRAGFFLVSFPSSTPFRLDGDVAMMSPV